MAVNKSKTDRRGQHNIRVKANGGYYAECDCGKFTTQPIFATAKEARGAGKDHLSEVW